jgi:antitoxin ParD1/3/4
VQQKNHQEMPRPDRNNDIACVRRQAAEGGLTFEVYLPPGLAAWVIGLVEQEVFHSPSEAVFVVMQSFRELDQHPDLKRELPQRTLQNRVASAEEDGGMPAEEVIARLRNATEGLRAEPAVWDKALDRPLFPEDSSA